MNFKLWLQWLRGRKVEQRMQEMAIGVNSTVDVTQDLHIVMLDYDIMDVERVIESVKELQDFWGLSDISVYRTRHGHHAIGWYDQVPYERLRMIVDYARYVDPLFKYISRYHDHKTLRVAGKHDLPDIVLDRVLQGKRRPTVIEVQRGELKRKEHTQLLRAERLSTKE